MKVRPRARIKMISRDGIHSGAVIHHHDQSITPVNLRVVNNKNSRPGKPILKPKL